MVTVTLHDGQELDQVPTLAQAVAEAREHWNEEEGEQAFLVRGEGCVLAVLMRDQSDPEVCHTLYADGSVEHHRCRYVLDAEGRYARTLVAELHHHEPHGWLRV